MGTAAGGSGVRDGGPGDGSASIKVSKMTNVTFTCAIITKFTKLIVKSPIN